MSLLEKVQSIDAAAIKYLIVGLGNTIVGLLIIYLAKWLFGFGDVVANALGYICGLGLSFVLNKRWTFCYRGQAWSALVRFLVVIAFAYASNLLVVLTAISILNINSYFSQALGIIPYTAIGYFGSRFFAFSENTSAQENVL